MDCLDTKKTGDMASKAVEVSTSRHKMKKRRGQFCVAGGPYGTKCKVSTYSHGVPMQTCPANQTTNRLWTNFVPIHRLDFMPCKKSSFRSLHIEISCLVDIYGTSGGKYTEEVFILYLQG